MSGSSCEWFHQRWLWFAVYPWTKGCWIFKHLHKWPEDHGKLAICNIGSRSNTVLCHVPSKYCSRVASILVAIIHNHDYVTCDSYTLRHGPQGLETFLLAVLQTSVDLYWESHNMKNIMGKYRKICIKNITKQVFRDQAMTSQCSTASSRLEGQSYPMVSLDFHSLLLLPSILAFVCHTTVF